MILNIQGPKDSISTTIQANEILRLETCVLEFFDKKLFNLYIIVKAESDENFHLFPYSKLDEFKLAHSSITNMLQEKPEADNFIIIEPVPKRCKVSEVSLS